MFTILLGLLVCVLLLLLIPLDVIFHLDTESRPGVRINIAWGYGLIRKDFIQGESKPIAKSAATPQPPKELRNGVVKSKRTKSAMIFVRNPGMLARLFRFARDMLRQFRVREIKLRLHLGLDDPANTGRLYGTLSPLLCLVQRMPRVDLRVQPDFSRAVFMATGRGEIRVIPLAVIGVMLGLFLSPTCWRAFYAAVKGANS